MLAGSSWEADLRPVGAAVSRSPDATWAVGQAGFSDAGELEDGRDDRVRVDDRQVRDEAAVEVVPPTFVQLEPPFVDL